MKPIKKIAAVTACPTGIAHTFMAAEALKNRSNCGLRHSRRNPGIRRSQKSTHARRHCPGRCSGDRHRHLRRSLRFTGKRVYQTSTKHALKDGKDVIESALALPEPTAQAAAGQGNYMEAVKQAKAQQSAKRSGPYKHLLTGVSYMLPVIVAGD